VPARAACPGEDPLADGRPEAPAEQVAHVVADERAAGGQRDQHRDPGVGAAGGGDAERDDRGLAGHQGDQGIERGQGGGDGVRRRGRDVKRGEADQLRPPLFRAAST